MLVVPVRIFCLFILQELFRTQGCTQEGFCKKNEVSQIRPMRFRSFRRSPLPLGYYVYSKQGLVNSAELSSDFFANGVKPLGSLGIFVSLVQISNKDLHSCPYGVMGNYFCCPLFLVPGLRPFHLLQRPLFYQRLQTAYRQPAVQPAHRLLPAPAWV